ncbi:hypothetical protein [Paenibacillus sp. MY03]|uniref:hypothetical protein n=1 Tax=Paenibacillus sp. MY03 TaxID=302980 RepID=UPI00117C9067|nr:hypothetical protein [Paenibacillus sp. MY03]
MAATLLAARGRGMLDWRVTLLAARGRGTLDWRVTLLAARGSGHAGWRVTLLAARGRAPVWNLEGKSPSNYRHSPVGRQYSGIIAL